MSFQRREVWFVGRCEPFHTRRDQNQLIWKRGVMLSPGKRPLIMQGPQHRTREPADLLDGQRAVSKPMQIQKLKVTLGMGLRSALLPTRIRPSQRMQRWIIGSPVALTPWRFGCKRRQIAEPQMENQRKHLALKFPRLPETGSSNQKPVLPPISPREREQQPNQLCASTDLSGTGPSIGKRRKPSGFDSLGPSVAPRFVPTLADQLSTDVTTISKR